MKEPKAEIITVQCPECGQVYGVNKENLCRTSIACGNCGAKYVQAVHIVINPEFIRQAAYRCRGEK